MEYRWIPINFSKERKNAILLVILGLSVILAIPQNNTHSHTTKTETNTIEWEEPSEEPIGRVIDDLKVYADTPKIENIPQSSTMMTRPTKGNVSVLAMPVRFSDKSESTTQSTIDNRWDGITGSVQHYYLENSFNQLNITVETKAWIQAPNTIAYYGNNEFASTREFELANWVMDQWDTTTDFSSFQYIYIVYAGEDDLNDTRLWPHVWTIYGTEEGINANYLPKRDGMTYDKLGFVGEFSAMGTFAHEFGHSLGLIDYYPASGEENCGVWELMDSGNYNDGGNHPAHLSAYSKIELGWIRSDQILELSTNNIANVKIYHLEEGNLPFGYYYAVKIPYSASIYYLIEFRDNHGYDAYLPDSGILWARVDLTKGSNEGRLYYVGGDHNTQALTGVEIDDDETEDSNYCIRWLTGAWEISVSANQEYANYMESNIDRNTDLGDAWDVYSNLGTLTELVWTYENLNVGEILMINWDTTSVISGSDFMIRNNNTGSWVDILTKNDIKQDSMYYRISTPGDYRIVVYNDNIAGKIDVYYKIWKLDAPLTSLTYIGADMILLPNQTTQFNLPINISNINTAWNENTNLTISLPSDLQLASGEMATKNWTTPFYQFNTTITWSLLVNSTGQKTITIYCNGTYNSTIMILELNFGIDSTSPIINFLGNPSILYTNFLHYCVNWTITDIGTGVKNFSLYQNSTEILNGDKSITGIWLTFNKEGYYTISLDAYDYAANKGTSSVIICYDYTKPELRSIDSTITGLSIGKYTLKLTAFDALSGINRVEIRIKNKLLGNATLRDNQYQYDIDLSNYINDPNVEVEIRIIDNATNFYAKNITLSLGTSIIDLLSNLTTKEYIFLGVGVVGIAVITSWIRGRKEKRKKNSK